MYEPNSPQVHTVVLVNSNHWCGSLQYKHVQLIFHNQNVSKQYMALLLKPNIYSVKCFV